MKKCSKVHPLGWGWPCSSPGCISGGQHRPDKFFSFSTPVNLPEHEESGQGHVSVLVNLTFDLVAQCREHTTLNCQKPLKSCLKNHISMAFCPERLLFTWNFWHYFDFCDCLFCQKKREIWKEILLLVKPRKFCWHCKEFFWAETLQISELFVTVDTTNKWCEQHCFF